MSESYLKENGSFISRHVEIYGFVITEFTTSLKNALSKRKLATLVVKVY